MYTKNLLPKEVSPNAIKPDSTDLVAHLETRHRRRPVLTNLYVSPGSEIQNKIISVWESGLGYTEIGSRDNLFFVGGDWLQLTRIAARLAELFGIELSFGDFFRFRALKPSPDLSPVEFPTLLRPTKS